MIKSFGDRRTRRFVEEGAAGDFLQAISKAARRKIMMIESASSLGDLGNFPGNRLEKLKGNRKDQYSIRINDQYRVCFRFEGCDAYDVEITDYH